MAKREQPAKRHKQSLKRKDRNYGYRSRLRTFMKAARLAVVTNTEDKQQLVEKACRELDRMVTKGVIHPNNASRRKSRLLKALHGRKKIELPVSDQPAGS